MARLRSQTRPARLGRRRPGEEVAFLGPSGYSRARAVVKVTPEGAGARVAGTLRFGRLERLSVLLGALWVLVFGVRLLLSVVTGGGLLSFAALALLGGLGVAATWARRRDRRRMRSYLESVLVPALPQTQL